jgi:hypothetical protein
LGLSPAKLLVKFPVPFPSVVRLSEIVGDWDVLQQTPLAVTEELPCEVTFPPHEAVVCVILLAAFVVKIGTCETGGGLLLSSPFLQLLVIMSRNPIDINAEIQILVIFS